MKVALFAAVVTLFALAGCGSGSSPAQATATVALSTDHVAAAAHVSGATPTASVQLNYTDAPSGINTVRTSITTATTGIVNLVPAFNRATGMPLSIEIVFPAPSTLNPGMYTDQYSIDVCLEQNCSRTLNPAPMLLTIDYTVTV